jgi:enamine deaminase RidA (YjgF/YER057c/UK114 family)
VRKKIFHWLGKEFIALSCEGNAGLNGTEETQEIFSRFSDELRARGLSLDNTVRTRLWTRDRESRNLASQVRTKILSGRARSASSSYIAPVYFASEARIALDLLAIEPSRPGLVKILKEYDPPVTPLRYVSYDSIVFLSGDSDDAPTLADQVNAIVPRLSASLEDAGTSWDKAVKISFFLHRNQNLNRLKELFKAIVDVEIPHLEYAFVDGYSREGKFIEIEVAASGS